eukprot:523060-Rhodomonas_salina.1
MHGQAGTAPHGTGGGRSEINLPVHRRAGQRGSDQDRQAGIAAQPFLPHTWAAHGPHPHSHAQPHAPTTLKLAAPQRRSQ